MYIIGTSGHIDHGKTTLIKALSGIDCDRLPEEKEREMTIDLGFASIEYPRFGTVSIVDVPGHERFIRNMVIGAWGLDMALLIVAVDDGWMPQTEDHFRVLQLLGIERIVVVINKIDLADAEMIDFVRDEIKERLSETDYADSDIVEVSAKIGKGIDDLKEVIVNNLRKLEKVPDEKKPYLFVDRVFGAKGHGTVVTGTLKNGFFKEEDEIFVLPGEKRARIKRIESHFQEKQEGNPSQRTALNLSGTGIDEVMRGSIIVRRNFFTFSSELIAGIHIIDSAKKVRNNAGIELLVGSRSISAKFILFAEQSEESQDFTVRIKLDEPWYFYPGERFVITNPGGYRITGGGVVLLPDYNSSRLRTRIKQIELNGYSLGSSRLDILRFMINLKRFYSMQEIADMFPVSAKRTEKLVQSLVDEGIVVVKEGYVLEKGLMDQGVSIVGSVIESGMGLNLKEIADKAGFDVELCRLLLPSVLDNYTVMEKDGRYFPGSAITVETLPPERRDLLNEVLKNGIEGVELDKIKDDKKKKSLRELIKMDFIVSLDGNILYHPEIYEDLKNRVIRLFDSADRITVPEAKDATGLSRKYIIPLLNRIESDGLIKRLGDFRIKS